MALVLLGGAFAGLTIAQVPLSSWHHATLTSIA
jgi:hypothetical protein